MRYIFALLIFALPLAAHAERIPDLICREIGVRDIDPKTLQVRQYESSTTYRFANGSLYLSNKDRDEYLYGSVLETEPGRYSVGHKTIYVASHGSDPITIQLTHVYTHEVRVSLAKCTKL